MTLEEIVLTDHPEERSRHMANRQLCLGPERKQTQHLLHDLPFLSFEKLCWGVYERHDNTARLLDVQSLMTTSDYTLLEINTHHLNVASNLTRYNPSDQTRYPRLLATQTRTLYRDPEDIVNTANASSNTTHQKPFAVKHSVTQWTTLPKPSSPSSKTSYRHTSAPTLS